MVVNSTVAAIVSHTGMCGMTSAYTRINGPTLAEAVERNWAQIIDKRALGNAAGYGLRSVRIEPCHSFAALKDYEDWSPNRTDIEAGATHRAWTIQIESYGLALANGKPGYARHTTMSLLVDVAYPPIAESIDIHAVRAR